MDTVLDTPVINFKPSKKQDEALTLLMDNETDNVGYGGSAFSGKSYLLCYWLCIMCFAFPGTGWGLGRKELVTLKKTTLITLFKVFLECNIKPTRDFMFNQQLNVITFTNTSQIFLIDTASTPTDPLFTRFGGYELTGCAVDESAETSQIAIEILSTRTGRRLNNQYGIRAKMLETFNPAKNHVYNKYYKPWKEGAQKSGTRFIKALPKDNPSPEVDAYVAKLISNGSAITIERLVKGNFEFDDDPATLIQYDKIIDCYTNSFLPTGTKYITADIARFGKDKTVVGVWDDMRVKIYTFTKLSVTESASKIDMLRKQHSIVMSNVLVDEDGVGGGVMDVLGCKGFVNNSRPLDNPATMQPDNYSNLKSQCYFMMAADMNNGMVYIDCDATIRDTITEELEQVKQWKMDQDGKKQIIPKDKVKELIGRSPDYSDMLMMRQWFKLAFKFTPSFV